MNGAHLRAAGIALWLSLALSAEAGEVQAHEPQVDEAQGQGAQVDGAGVEEPEPEEAQSEETQADQTEREDAEKPRGDHPLRLPIGDPERRDEVIVPELDTLVDTRTGDVLTPSKLAAKLAGTRLLLVGESHTSEEFHRVQEIVLRELDRSGRKVSVGLEMMPPESQAALDSWSAGELDDDRFLEASGWYEHWGYRWEYYRSIFELIRDRQLPMHGLNVPRDVVRAAREKGFDGLDPEDRRRLPDEIQPPTAEFKRLFLSYFGGGDAAHAFGDDEMLAGFLRAQTAWDASMAKNAAEALAEDPETIMVVLVGSGHVAYGLGIARHVAPMLEGEVATLIPVPVGGEDTQEISASYADFLWGVAEEPWTRYPSLGLSTAEVEDADDGSRKVLFTAEGSAAARAGLESGDVLVSIDGQAVDGSEVIRRVMNSKHWGDAVELRFRRDGDEHDVTAHLRRQP
ncbi:MAG: ChaN family lipoprotein [Acidobacteriota bacterium]